LPVKTTIAAETLPRKGKHLHHSVTCSLNRVAACHPVLSEN
jgi:hypothetical protein